MKLTHNSRTHRFPVDVWPDGQLQGPPVQRIISAYATGRKRRIVRQKKMSCVAAMLRTVFNLKF